MFTTCSDKSQKERAPISPAVLDFAESFGPDHREKCTRTPSNKLVHDDTFTLLLVSFRVADEVGCKSVVVLGQ